MKRLWSIEKKSPPTPPVFITSTSIPCGRTVMEPPPTSFSSRACVEALLPRTKGRSLQRRRSPRPINDVAKREQRDHRSAIHYQAIAHVDLPLRCTRQLLVMRNYDDGRSIAVEL